MAQIIRFPGTAEADIGPPVPNEGDVHDVDAPAIGERIELVDIPIEEIVAADQTITAMTDHFRGAKLDLSQKTLRLRAQIVSEYSLRQVIGLMGKSTKEDWMKHPALYGALAQRCLIEVFEGMDGGEEEQETPRLHIVPTQEHPAEN